MILNQIDFGGSHPWQAPVNGQMIGAAVVEGQATIGYSRGAQLRRYSVTFWAKAWQGIGGQTANSMAALRYLLKQGEELADNRDLNPVYIQWSSSAESGAPLNAADQHDGWYNIESFKPDYLRLSSGLVPVQMTVAMTATAPPRGLGQAYFGGALTTTFSGGSQIAIGYPFNAANQAATAVSRTGGEGAIPLSVAPATNLNPLPFTPSATLADWWKGGVRVWDTINTGSNAVPLAGLSVNANWVEVFQSDHRFEGDCVVTNGLLLLIFVAGQTRVCRTYLWSTGLSIPAWQQVADLTYYDGAGNIGTLRSYKVERIGQEETRIVTTSASSGGNMAEVAIRLQRGMYFGRADFKPLTGLSVLNYALALSPANAVKIVWNEGAASDIGTLAASAAPSANYGYAGAYTVNSALPFILLQLWQNKPGNLQPYQQSTTILGYGDNAGPAQNAIISYGFGAIPFGTSTDNVNRLQAEAEGGTLGTGWSSVADVNASAGNTAKLLSGTLAGNADTFGTSFTPAAGTYYPTVRWRNGGVPGTGTECSFGLVVAGVYTSQFTFGSGNGSIATYRFVAPNVGAAITLTGAQTVQFRCRSEATTTVDWFFDEAVLLPATLSGANAGPQEIWQQFLHDRTVRLTRI